jgi:hypothetical protein
VARKAVVIVVGCPQSLITGRGAGERLIITGEPHIIVTVASVIEGNTEAGVPDDETA